MQKYPQREERIHQVPDEYHEDIVESCTVILLFSIDLSPDVPVFPVESGINVPRPINIQSQGYSQKRQARQPIRTRDMEEGPRLFSSNDPENKRLIRILDPRRNLAFSPGSEPFEEV